MSFIFISYSRQDQDYVSTLVQALHSHRLPTWLDNRIDYGATWPRVIQDHLEQCEVFLLVMSPQSEDSHWVQCELSLALELRKPIFPLLLEGRRWLSVAAIQTVDVKGNKLPPARFFETVQTYFPSPKATAQSISIQEVAQEQITAPTTSPEPVVTASTTAKPETVFQPLADEPETETPTEIINLRSEKGIDYSRLRNLLEAGEWRAADEETYNVMIQTVGKESGDYFTDQDLLTFPCTDLKTIDSLWVHYSGGKWGFSVQKRIYVECGGKLDGNYPGKAIWHEFCRRVGWRKGQSYVAYSDLTFNLEISPAGEFPLIWGGKGCFLFSRTEACKV